MSPPELNSRTIKLQLPSLDTMKKLGKLGSALGSMGGVVALLVYIAYFEAQITPKTNLRIDNLKGEVTALQISLVEKTKGVASEPRLLELEGKTKMLARDLDNKASMADILQMELRLTNKMDDNLKEIVRLWAQKEKQNRNGDAE